jgi:hypothetical protein
MQIMARPPLLADRGQPSILHPLWLQQFDAHNAKHEEREDLNAGWEISTPGVTPILPCADSFGLD